MQIHRKSIVYTSIVCTLTLVCSVLLTINSSAFSDNWSGFLLSLSISIFASSLLILFISVISYSVLRKYTARDSIQLFCQIIESYANLALFIQNKDVLAASDTQTINRFIIFDNMIVSLNDLIMRFINYEKISWPRPALFLKKALTNDTSLFSTEIRVLVNCTEALNFSSACHVNLVEIRNYDKLPQQKKAMDTFVKNWDNLYEYFRADGKLNKYFNSYIKLLGSVQVKKAV